MVKPGVLLRGHKATAEKVATLPSLICCLGSYSCVETCHLFYPSELSEAVHNGAHSAPTPTEETRGDSCCHMVMMCSLCASRAWLGRICVSLP